MLGDNRPGRSRMLKRRSRVNLFKHGWPHWGTRRAAWQWSSLNILQLSGTGQTRTAGSGWDFALDSICCFLSALNQSLILLSGVVVRHLHSDFSSIFSTALQWVPVIVLTSTGNDQVLQIDPGLSDNVSLLVVIKHGNLQFVVIRGFVYGETEFGVPGASQYPLSIHLIVYPGLPSGSLSSSQICLCLLCFFAQSCCSIRVLLAHSLTVGQVFGAVDNNDQSSNDRTIDGDISEDTRRMVDLGYFRHGEFLAHIGSGKENHWQCLKF